MEVGGQPVGASGGDVDPVEIKHRVQDTQQEQHIAAYAMTKRGDARARGLDAHAVRLPSNDHGVTGWDQRVGCALSRRCRRARPRPGRPRLPRSSSQPSGSDTSRPPVVRPRGRPSTDSGNGCVGIELAEQVVQFGEARHLGQRTSAARLADGEALEIPGHVLAEVGHARACSPTQSASSSAWRRIIAATAPRVGTDPLGATGEGRGEIGEQPRPAEAAAADDDAGAAGLARPSAARRRPPRCRRCRAPGCRAARPGRRSPPSRPRRRRSRPRCGRAARPRRRRRPARAARPRGR